jgi:hypothetical protein
MDQGLLMGHGRWPLGSSLRLKAVGFSHSANTSACLPIPMHSLRCTKGPHLPLLPAPVKMAGWPGFQYQQRRHAAYGDEEGGIGGDAQQQAGSIVSSGSPSPTLTRSKGGIMHGRVHTRH